jgi:probable phosphoglycerate mutase
MSIFLVRHGETVENRTRVVQVPEAPLSGRGRAQAERLAARLAREGVARILASDLERAAMTARIVAGRTGASVEHDARLQERNFGDVRGTPYDALEVDLFGPDFVPPAGESWPAFHARVDEAWQCIASAAAETTGNLAVVTHGLVCYSLALRHLALPDGEPAPMRWGNTSLTIVDPEAPFSVRVLNCTAHLDAAAEADAARAVV